MFCDWLGASPCHACMHSSYSLTRNVVSDLLTSRGHVSALVTFLVFLVFVGGLQAV